MFKKLTCFVTIVLILLAGNASAADISYNDSVGDHLWSNPGNWNGGSVPSDSLTGASFNGASTEVQIPTGVNAVCKGFMLGMYGVTNSAEISGGSLSCSWLDLGRANQNGGNGILTVTDGTVTVSGDLKIPTQFSTAVDPTKLGTGHLELSGGTVFATRFHMGSRLTGDGGGKGTVNITNGALVINGSVTSQLQGYINNGWITFYGSGDDYELDYSVRNSGRTTLTAIDTGQAYNPNPDNDAFGVELDKELSWLVTATSGSTNVYFGTTNPPPFIRNQLLTEKTYAPGLLTPNTKYYWRIDNLDGIDEVQGRLWSFTTDGPPAACENPEPADLVTGVNPIAELAWVGAPNADSYDVYFGDTDPPAFVGSQTDSLYDLPMLEADTTYYWRVDPNNQHGTTVGPTWSFRVSELPQGDINGDWFVTLSDLNILASRWLDGPCQTPDWCGDADIDQDSNVNLVDFSLMAPQYETLKPNVIIFFTDDQGWSETSVPMMQGRSDSYSDFLQTPALEQMAQDGMVFSNAYASAPTCTPSRGGILCGKTPARLKVTTVHDVLATVNGVDLNDHATIPQIIKSIDPDYVTAHFGKWGTHVSIDPDEAGYDQSDGDTDNGDGDYLDVQNRTPLPADDPKRIFSVADRADDFMEEQVLARKPFFMQLSHYAVHVDHMALAETIEKYRNLPPASQSKYNSESGYLYAAMIENLDTALGRLLQKVEELGIKDNTYIIFTSDNGGGFSGNAPLKEGKARMFEGGLRVPTVICGPGVLQGSYCDKPIAAWDFLPTVNEIIGGAPLPAEFDGGSLVDLLERGNNGQIQRGTEELIFHFPYYAAPPNSCIRDGNYKLMLNLNNYEYRLFDLTTDIGEENDLKATMPTLALQMYNRLNQYLTDVGAEDVEDHRLARIAELEGWIADELAKDNPDAAKIANWEDGIDQAEQNRLLDMDGNIIQP